MFKRVLNTPLRVNIKRQYPARINMFKVNTRNTRKRREICSKLKKKTRELRQ